MKKQLTATQKRNRYRIISKASFVGEFGAVATPFVVMGAINFDEWFKVPDSWKVGLGGAIAFALLGLIVFIITKKKEDNDSKTGGYVTLLLGWYMAAFVLLLVTQVIYNIATIMFVGGTGIAGALGLEIVHTTYENKANLYTQALQEYKLESAKNEVYEQAQRDAKIEQIDRHVKF